MFVNYTYKIPKFSKIYIKMHVSIWILSNTLKMPVKKNDVHKKSRINSKLTI